MQCAQPLGLTREGRPCWRIWPFNIWQLVFVLWAMGVDDSDDTCQIAQVGVHKTKPKLSRRQRNCPPHDLAAVQKLARLLYSAVVLSEAHRLHGLGRLQLGRGSLQQRLQLDFHVPSSVALMLDASLLSVGSRCCCTSLPSTSCTPFCCAGASLFRR